MNLQPLETYLSLCTEVYDLSKPTPDKDAYEFYLDYVKNTEGLILEPMCGTGRMLLPLLDAGFNIEGFDASPQMLEALQKKAKQKNLQPNIWQGFLEDLNVSQKYSLIIIPIGSFCLITDLEKVKLCLTKIYNALQKEGLFVFEVETLFAVPAQFNVWNGSLWRREDGSFILSSSFALPLEDKVGTSIGKYEWVKDSHIIQTEIEEYKLRLYEKNELIEILKEIGFTDIKTHKAFEKNVQPGIKDENIVFECRK